MNNKDKKSENFPPRDSQGTEDKQTHEDGKEDRNIQPGLMVHAKGEGSMKGSSGKHVGIVDHIDGDEYIKLKRDNTGNHRWIPSSWVDRVDDKAIYLSKTEAEFFQGVLNNRPETGSASEESNDTPSERRAS